MFAQLPFEAQLLVLRGAVLVLLYLFVALALLVLGGELRRAAVASKPRPRRSALGQLILVDPGPSGIEPGHSFPLAAVSSLGRSLRNVVSIDDEFLSAEHALLSWREGKWWIEDLGSKNGTLLNGVPVIRPVPLGPGDTIEIGRVALRLE